VEIEKKNLKIKKYKNLTGKKWAIFGKRCSKKKKSTKSKVSYSFFHQRIAI